MDIHGAGKNRPFLIEYDDFRRRKTLEEIERNLLRCLKRFGFVDSEITRGLLQKDQQQTITEFCIEKLKIPALQLEINRKIRDPQNLKFNRLLSALSCLINEVLKL